MRWRNSYRWRKNFCGALPRRTGLRNLSRHSGHSYNLKRRDDLRLPKAVVKIVAERNERIADVPINALYIAFFLSIAVSLPVIVVGFYSNLLNLRGISQYELIFVTE